MNTGAGFVALRVQHGRSRFCRFEQIENSRQFPVLDFDKFQRLFRDVAAFGRHQRHHFADVAHAIRGYDRLVINHRPEIGTQASQIVPRDHGDDARQFLCFAGIDSEQIGVSIGTAQRLGV